MSAPFVRILNGDVLDHLRELPDGSVHCVVTSPPYWGLRDYSRCGCALKTVGSGHITEHSGEGDGASRIISVNPDPSCPKCHGTGKDEEIAAKQIGLEKTPEEYIAKIVAVFREVKRVLRDDGTLWLNMGDCYSGNGGARTDSEGQLEKDNPAYAKWNRDYGELKVKDLVGMPWRVAFALQADGWTLRSDIIWAKPNPMPESVTDRPTKAHEYLFLFAKSRSYFYDADAIRESQAPSTEARARYHYPNAIDNPDYDSKHPEGDFRRYPIQGQLKKRVKVPGAWDLGPGGHGTINRDGRTEATYQDAAIRADRNARTVWTIPTEPYPEAHFATFPKKLVEPCIKAGTSERGCCAICGAGWERITDITRTFDPRSGKHPVGKNPQSFQGSKGGVRGPYDVRMGPLRSTKTLDFHPICACSGDLVPCVVLDPFAGSGTVGEVARSLGRSSILIELNPQYVALARERTREDLKPLETFT